MKKLILVLVMLLIFTACSSGGFVSSLEKQLKNLESYNAEYTVTMNGVNFQVVEEFTDKGNHHIIRVDSEDGYRQEIELIDDKVILKNLNLEQEIVGKRENFQYPVFVLYQIIQDIVAEKEDVTINENHQIVVRNGDIKVSHEGKKITQVELNVEGTQMLIEYKSIDIN